MEAAQRGVAVCLPPEVAGSTGQIVRLAVAEGKTVRIPVEPSAARTSNTQEEEVEGFIVRSIVNGGQREVGLAVKCAMDIVGSALGLVLISPLLLAVALTIRLREGGPVLFSRTRVGLHGRLFTLYRFRWE